MGFTGRQVWSRTGPDKSISLLLHGISACLNDFTGGETGSLYLIKRCTGRERNVTGGSTQVKSVLNTEEMDVSFRLLVSALHQIMSRNPVVEIKLVIIRPGLGDISFWHPWLNDLSPSFLLASREQWALSCLVWYEGGSLLPSPRLLSPAAFVGCGEKAASRRRSLALRLQYGNCLGHTEINVLWQEAHR